LALFSLAALLTLVFATTGSAGTVLTNSGFEADDGNLVVDDTFDWNGFDPVTWEPSPSDTPTRTAEDVASGFQFTGIEDWEATTSDSGFAGGTKQDKDCPSVITAKAPNKDDLKRIYLASSTGSDGHTYLELAWVRIPQNTTSASAHVAFEFNKGTTACGPASGGLVERTAGDMLIVYDFEGGATTPTLTLRRWVTSGACEINQNSAPCWGPATDLTAAGFAEAKVNVGQSVLDALTPPALSSATGTSVDSTLGDSEFGEAGIDLTAAGVITPGVCESFGTAFGVSRSSGNSGQAQMKDLVGPADFSINTCGAIQVTKTRKHAADGPGDHPHAGVTFTVTQNGTTVATGETDADGEICFGGLADGDYTVTETVPAGYVTSPADPQSVTVDNVAACGDDPFGGETVAFHNTPLTDLNVSVNSQVDGGTASTINCLNSANETVASGTTDTNGDGSAPATNLPPDTYTCTVVIDP
jgi:Prealbumin-like fold domain